MPISVRWSRTLILLVILVIVSASPLVLSAQQDTGVTATVSANIASLQSGPGLDFPSVGTATSGQQFPVLGRAHGSNRVWYEVRLPAGGTAWLSERIVLINPSPDGLPWLGDNLAKTPLVMDCGKYPPLLFVGAFAQVISDQGVVLYSEAGLGKPGVGGVASKGYVQILNGPFCTAFSPSRYQIQWRVVNQAGVIGYMLESMPNGQDPFVKLTTDVSSPDFPAVATPAPTEDASTSSGVSNARPENLTDADIQTVKDIFAAVQNQKYSQADVTYLLQQFVNSHNAASLAWIVRHIPIYNGRDGVWYSFDMFQDYSLMNFRINSDLDIKPVDTTIGILFGRYATENDILSVMGCG
ncbi:MAG TPA: SH3 domain-containing protein [Aggregatilineales bacterium]|nr:SH3 domain-containing protein [Aggregatilineales bacterium]